MLTLLDVDRGDPDGKSITTHRLAFADVPNGNLVADWAVLAERQLADCFSRCAKRHGNGGMRGGRFEYRRDVVIGLKQNGSDCTHSHVEVASSASANALVPASTTPE